MKAYHLRIALLIGLLLATLAVACSPTPTAGTVTPTVIREIIESEILVEDIYVNPLAEIDLVFNTTLPPEPTDFTIFRLSAPGAPSVAEVRQMATEFGLPGEIYYEVPPGYAKEPGATEEGIPQPSLIYHAFAGTRTFFYSFYNNETRIDYVDRHVPISYDRANFSPFDRAGPVAEAFLKQGGLLNFPYQIAPGSSGDVQFLRLVDGHPLIHQPEFTAYVDTASLVFAVSYFPLQSLVPQGEYPGLSAADAWQLVPQATGDQVTYFITPDPANLPPVATPLSELNSPWHRTYRDGQQADLYGNTTVYQPVEGAGPPRIRLDWFWLEAADAELQTVAEQVQPFVHVWGTVRVDRSNSWSLELAGWESVPGPDSGYHSLAGTIQVTDGQKVLHTDEGQILLLPDAPSDLAHDERVWVHGPAIEPADGPYPRFQWRRIEPHRALATEAPVIGDEAPALNQAVISAVDLVYLYKAAHNTGFTDTDGSPLNLVVPAWRFTGTTNNAELIEIIVQAVADESYGR